MRDAHTQVRQRRKYRMHETKQAWTRLLVQSLTSPGPIHASLGLPLCPTKPSTTRQFPLRGCVVSYFDGVAIVRVVGQNHGPGHSSTNSVAPCLGGYSYLIQRSLHASIVFSLSLALSWISCSVSLPLGCCTKRREHSLLLSEVKGSNASRHAPMGGGMPGPGPSFCDFFGHQRRRFYPVSRGDDRCRNDELLHGLPAGRQPRQSTRAILLVGGRGHVWRNG